MSSQAEIETAEADQESLETVIDDLHKASKLQGAASGGAGNSTGRIGESVFNIPVEFQVLVGTAKMLVSELMGIEKNSVVPLNSKIGDPVFLMVNGVCVGTGELEVAEDNPDQLCIRVVDLTAR